MVRAIVSALLCAIIIGCGSRGGVGSISEVGLASGEEIFFPGKQSGEQFGTAVDFVGDLNGDGIDEIVVGAPDNFDGGPGAGRVAVYFSPHSSTSQPFEIIGVAGDQVGFAVAGLGDINGDGAGDIAIGQPGRNRVVVFSGARINELQANSQRASISDGQLVIEFDGGGINGMTVSRFGEVLSTGADLNRDGQLDLIVGVPNTLPAPSGAIFFFQGGQSLQLPPAGSPLSIFLLASAAELIIRLDDTVVGQFGGVVTYGGDVNGDYDQAGQQTPFGDDLLIGMPNGANGGSVIVLGGSNGVGGNIPLALYPRRTIIRRPDRSSFGRSVTALPSLNGDNFDEVVVGFDGGLSVYRGFSQVGVIENRNFDLIADGAGSSSLFSLALAGGIGRLPTANGLLVGDPGDSFLSLLSGGAFLFGEGALRNMLAAETQFLASAQIAASFRAQTLAPLQNRLLGARVRYGGDLNSDGEADALIATPGYAGLGPQTGGLLLVR